MIGAERPREIVNPATGEIVRFIRTADETGGELLVLEDRWTRMDHEVPAHVHPAIEERWQVIEGTIGYRVGGRETIAGAGESVLAAPGELHSSWNHGRRPALVRIEMRPALRWEEFIRQLFALAGEGFEGEVGERSFIELFTEFAPEIELVAPTELPIRLPESGASLANLRPVSDWEKLSGLPVEVASFEFEANDREYSPEFTRGSTLVRIRGAGHEGVGEDVVYDVLDHVANRDLGPRFDLTGAATLGELCERLGELDLFEGSPPEREESRLYRRWAYESAALDLALRQNGLALHTALERDPKPLRFVCSTRLTGFGEDESSSTDPIAKRLDRYPGLEFKLDPENDWSGELIESISEIATVRILDLKGFYRGTPVDVETDPELYRAVAEAFPEAYLEDPDLDEATRGVLEPHWERLTYDAPLHSVADISALGPARAVNSKPSRWGSLEELFAVYAHCEREGLAIYSGGQGEVGPGRGQVQYLASLYHPDTPNDIAPSGYNDPGIPAGLPTSPMDPAPSEAGFQWG